MSNLQQTIASLAQQFSADILRLVSSASLADIASLGGASARVATAARTGKAGARTPARRGTSTGAKRSAKQLQAVIDAVVSALADAGSGMRSEQLQKVLGMTKADLVGPIKVALESKAIRKTGQKRATTYFAP